MTTQAAREWIAFANGGIYAENSNRSYRQFAAAPNRTTSIFEAGRPTMPADYRENHASIEEALEAIIDIVSVEKWIEAVI